MSVPGTDKESEEVFRARYQQFVSEHGELFEENTAPMDDDDHKRVNSFFNAVTGFFSFFSIVFFLLLYFKWPDTMKDQIYSVFMAAGIIGGFIWRFRAKKRMMTENVKTIIKGVITSKKSRKNKRRNTAVQISNRKEIVFIEADYRKYMLGDIVRVELLDGPGLQIATSRVTGIGRIPIETETVVPAEHGKVNSFWARSGRYVGRLLGLKG
jgi:hypothetical protein